MLGSIHMVAMATGQPLPCPPPTSKVWKPGRPNRRMDEGERRRRRVVRETPTRVSANTLDTLLPFFFLFPDSSNRSILLYYVSTTTSSTRFYRRRSERIRESSFTKLVHVPFRSFSSTTSSLPPLPSPSFVSAFSRPM